MEEKVSVTLRIEAAKLDVLEFFLKEQQNTTAQKKLEQNLRELYETTVPEEMRRYLESKSGASAKPKRPARPAPTSKSKNEQEGERHNGIERTGTVDG